MQNRIVLVVEGVSDKNRLENLVDADYVLTGGSAINEDTINYIKELVKTRTVIVLTDPDYPGMQIRNKIASAVPEVKHAYVDRSKSSDGKKLGVAECDKDEILRALANYVSYDHALEGTLTIEDMFTLGLSGEGSSLRREKIAKYFNVGYGNTKTILKRLNMLNISKEKILEVLENDR